jgi:hypothetical protein
MDLNKFFQSKIFRRVLIAVALLVIIFVSFGTGVFVGYRKASFSYAWSENYDRNFGGPHHGIFGIAPLPTPKPSNDFPNAHGTFGTILNIATSDITINSPDGVERTVRLSSSTIIKERSENIGPADLEAGEPIVVIGSPNNQGQIDARLIRVMK